MKFIALYQHCQSTMSFQVVAALTLVMFSCLHQGPSTVNAVLLPPGYVSTPIIIGIKAKYAGCYTPWAIKTCHFILDYNFRVS